MTPKYTPEQEAQLTEAYAAGTSVEDLAQAMGKSVRSVVAKLSALKLYKAPKKAQPEVGMRKADLVAIIEGRYAQDPGTFAEMEKLTKATLMKLACED